MPKKKTADTDIWSGAMEIPVAGMPDESVMARSAKRYRRMIKASIVLVPILAVALIIVLGNSSSATVTTAAPAATSSAGSAAATAALRTWLPGVLPGGQVIQWSDSTAGPAPKVDQEGKALSLPTERDVFVVADQAGRFYQVSVLVSIDSTAGATVIGDPSLIPMTPARPSDYKAGSQWPNLTVGTVPGPVAGAVTAWGKRSRPGIPMRCTSPSATRTPTTPTSQSPVSSPSP